MNFRVYTILEIPILEKEYELLIPIDRRIHNIITILVRNIPELSRNYYMNNKPNLYNKATGEKYDMNQIIKNSNIKTIFTTGKKSYNLYMKYCYKNTKILPIYLPSTSPANIGNYSLEDLVNEYKIILDYI